MQCLDVAVRKVGAGYREGADGTVQVLLPRGERGGLLGRHPVAPAALFLRGGTHSRGVAGGVALGIAGLLAGGSAGAQGGKTMRAGAAPQ